jgi:MFS family permease
MPLASSISMNFAKDGNYGKRIGEIQGLSNLAIIVASATLYLVYRFFNVPYSAVFIIASIAMIASGILFLFMHEGHAIKSNKRFVFKKEFKLYYGLSLVNGARKQITLTFLPWLIIDTFAQPVTTIALLFFIVCVINVFFKPFLGGFIDKFGERLTLRFEAIFMGIVCIGLAFAKTLFPFEIALIIVSVCYVLDNMLISASMARATYIRKLSKEKSEITRTLSMGQSIDHVISMFIPLLAGYVWYVNGPSGYMYVFLGGIVLSISNYILASKITIPKNELEKY